MYIYVYMYILLDMYVCVYTYTNTCTHKTKSFKDSLSDYKNVMYYDMNEFIRDTPPKGGDL